MRIALSKLSVSSNRLEIEAWRCNKPHKTPRENRKCKNCNILEDEYCNMLWNICWTNSLCVYELYIDVYRETTWIQKPRTGLLHSLYIEWVYIRLQVDYIVNSKYKNIQHPPFKANDPINKENMLSPFLQNNFTTI